MSRHVSFCSSSSLSGCARVLSRTRLGTHKSRLARARDASRDNVHDSFGCPRTLSSAHIRCSPLRESTRREPYASGGVFGGLQSFIGSTMRVMKRAPSIRSSFTLPLSEEISGDDGSFGGTRSSAGAQPSQSQLEQPRPHWPEPPQAQLQKGFGGGGGDGPGAQPSQSHDEHAAPHWPLPPQAQLQNCFGVAGGGGGDGSGAQPSQSQLEQPRPHWPEPPQAQLQKGFGGGGGEGGVGGGAQPSQSHDEHAAPHWPLPPQPQLQNGLGGEGSGGEGRGEGEGGGDGRGESSSGSSPSQPSQSPAESGVKPGVRHGRQGRSGENREKRETCNRQRILQSHSLTRRTASTALAGAAAGTVAKWFWRRRRWWVLAASFALARRAACSTLSRVSATRAVAALFHLVLFLRVLQESRILHI